VRSTAGTNHASAMPSASGAPHDQPVRASASRAGGERSACHRQASTSATSTAEPRNDVAGMAAATAPSSTTASTRSAARPIERLVEHEQRAAREHEERDVDGLGEQTEADADPRDQLPATGRRTSFAQARPGEKHQRRARQQQRVRRHHARLDEKEQRGREDAARRGARCARRGSAAPPPW
jgi:hypothetical protein